MESVEQLAQSPLVRVAWFALVLLLLIIVVWLLRSKGENLIGSGIQDKVFTSGATMRRLAQEFSGTNQGTYGIIHNDEIQELVPGVISGKERLVNERGEPDFWEISSELNAYKESQVAPMAGDAAANASGQAEYLGPTSIAAQVEDELLRQRLYR